MVLKHCDLMFKKRRKTKVIKWKETVTFILWQPSIKSSIMQRDNRKLVQCVSVIGCQSPQQLKCVLLYAVYTELMQLFCPLSSLCQSGLGQGNIGSPSSPLAVLVNQWRLVGFVWWPSNVVSPFLLLPFCMYYFFLFLLLLCCRVVYGPLSLFSEIKDSKLAQRFKEPFFCH